MTHQMQLKQLFLDSVSDRRDSGLHLGKSFIIHNANLVQVSKFPPYYYEFIRLEQWGNSVTEHLLHSANRVWRILTRTRRFVVGFLCPISRAVPWLTISPPSICRSVSDKSRAISLPRISPEGNLFLVCVRYTRAIAASPRYTARLYARIGRYPL